MIISHKHKFIFIKTTKTAGTSIEIALSKICGPDDVLTKISKKDQVVRKKLGYPGPQNYYAPFSDYDLIDVWKLIIQGRRKKRFFHHIGATEIKKHVGDEIWNSYYKFCFERNPFDRLISNYWWSYRYGERPDFKDYIKSLVPNKAKQSGWGLYTINNTVVVDKIYRFESLQEEMAHIQSKLGIEEELSLPKTKSKSRKDRRDYQEVYSDSERKIVEEIFKDEMELMKYSF